MDLFIYSYTNKLISYVELLRYILGKRLLGVKPLLALFLVFLILAPYSCSPTPTPLPLHRSWPVSWNWAEADKKL